MATIILNEEETLFLEFEDAEQQFVIQYTNGGITIVQIAGFLLDPDKPDFSDKLIYKSEAD